MLKMVVNAGLIVYCLCYAVLRLCCCYDLRLAFLIDFVTVLILFTVWLMSRNKDQFNRCGALVYCKTSNCVPNVILLQYYSEMEMHSKFHLTVVWPLM